MIDIVEGFLDDTRDYIARARSLNDHRVTDNVLESLLVTLDPDLRSRALLACFRPSVLTTWAEGGDVDDRLAIAENPSIDESIRLRLVHDSSEIVRCLIARYWAVDDLEVFAALVRDPSQHVQDALVEALRDAREDDTDQIDDQSPGSDESLSFLYEMVGATQEMDLLEEAREGAPLDDVGCVVDQTFDTIAGFDGGLYIAADVWREMPEQGEDDEIPQLTLAQVVGLLRDKLGAEVIEQSSDGAVTLVPRRASGINGTA